MQARALVGISYASISATLTAVERVLDDPDLLRPARRHLGNLYADGVFSPPEQAPILTLGHVMAMAEATADSLTLLVVGTYRAALRPSEWAPVRYREHVGVADHEVTLVIPRMKGGGGRGLSGTLGDHPVLSLHRALQAWLEVRGSDPGLLVHLDGDPLEWAQVAYRLQRAAAAAGVRAFAPYSLRRSWSVHTNLTGTSVAAIPQRLGHRGGSPVDRRYIEPMLALQVAQGVNPATIWLDTTWTGGCTNKQPRSAPGGMTGSAACSPLRWLCGGS